MKRSGKKKRAVAIGSRLMDVRGILAMSPVEPGGVRAVWELPDKCSHGMLLMLWAHLAYEVNEITPETAPVKPFLRSVIQGWESLMAEGAKKVLD